jgi:hypothetical protein
LARWMMLHSAFANPEGRQSALFTLRFFPMATSLLVVP